MYYHLSQQSGHGLTEGICSATALNDLVRLVSGISRSLEVAERTFQIGVKSHALQWFVHNPRNARATLELDTSSVWCTLRSIRSGLPNDFKIALSEVAERKSAHSDRPDRSECCCRTYPE